MSRALTILWALVLALPPAPSCRAATSEEPPPASAATGCHGSAPAVAPGRERAAEDGCPCCESCCDCAQAPALSAIAAPLGVAAPLRPSALPSARIPFRSPGVLERPPSLPVAV